MVKIILGKNPDNDKQARLFFCMYTADENGETRHPMIVMRELAEQHNFKIITAVPQSLFDGWDLWIEYDIEPKLPDYFTEGIHWTPIGSV